MRIAVVHNLPAGGARRRLANQLPHLSGAIVEICLETATPITADATVLPLRPLAPRRSRLLRPPLRYLDMANLEQAWRQVAARIRSCGADVIYLNACRYLQAPPVLKGHVPPALYFCDEVRRVDAEPEAHAARSRLTTPLYAPIYARERQLDRGTVARAQAIATNSHHAASEIARVYGRRATVVRPGVAAFLRTPVSHVVGDAFLLSVGTLIPPKGHDLVIRAAAAASTRLPVRIVSPRAEPYERARLCTLAGELGVELEIRVDISDRELGELYDAAAVTLYLAQREPFGLVSLEAQARGCPMIVAAEGGLPETIIEGVTGWAVPREPAAAAALIDRLADPNLRERMSSAAREHALTWTWEASGSEVDTILANICDPAGRLATERSI
jgi:glycosyltransferase involved in cell wall biosynthesis